LPSSVFGILIFGLPIEPSTSISILLSPVFGIFIFDLPNEPPTSISLLLYSVFRILILFLCYSFVELLSFKNRRKQWIKWKLSKIMIT
jgi:hypothetical protein